MLIAPTEVSFHPILKIEGTCSEVSLVLFDYHLYLHHFLVSLLTGRMSLRPNAWGLFFQISLFNEHRNNNNNKRFPNSLPGHRLLLSRSFTFNTVLVEERLNLLMVVPYTAPGPDQISARIIKELATSHRQITLLKMPGFIRLGHKRALRSFLKNSAACLCFRKCPSYHVNFHPCESGERILIGRISKLLDCFRPRYLIWFAHHELKTKLTMSLHLHCLCARYDGHSESLWQCWVHSSSGQASNNWFASAYCRLD